MRKKVEFINLLIEITLAFRTITVFEYKAICIAGIEFSTHLELPNMLWFYCIAEVGLFIIPDYKAGNINNMIKSWGL
jgi:hypothetical protein